MKLTIVVLAAGRGTRMSSELPKVLHALSGVSMLQRVLDTAVSLHPEKLCVVYSDPRLLQQDFQQSIDWVYQARQQGTAHAVAQALPHIAEDSQVLVLYGDVPLVSQDLLKRFIEATPKHHLGIVCAHLDNPKALGRILRDSQGQVERIVEYQDASPEQRAVNEIFTGIVLAPRALLQRWIAGLDNQNVQQEYYLTDIIKKARQEKHTIHSTQAYCPIEIQGVNSLQELLSLERVHQRSMADALIASGVRVMDPGRLDIRGELHCGANVTIDINVIIEGVVVLGDNVRIGSNTLLRDCRIAHGVVVQSHTVIQGADIREHCVLGPFAHIRPGTQLDARVKVGNFVELKKVRLGAHTKVSHLSYLGDAELGERVNVGAGTVTCNYDGRQKHRTTIGSDAFVGSGTQFVAPVVVGAGATIGAGSVITKDAPEHQLTLSRSEQRSIAHWKRRK